MQKGQLGCVNKKSGFLQYVILNLLQRYFKHGISRVAAQFAYYFLFSFFPLLLFLNGLIGSFHINIQMVVENISFIPLEVKQMVLDYLTYLGTQDNNFTIMLVGLGLSVYSAVMAVNVIITSINIAFETKKKHGFKSLIISILFTFAIVGQLILSFLLLTIGGQITDFIYGIFPTLEQYAHIFIMIRFLIVGLFGLASLTALYMVAPTVHLTVKQAIASAAFAETAWIVVSMLFSLYTVNMANYSLIYGSIGAFIVLMIWFYISGIILAIGGELSFILNHREITDK